MPNHVTNILSIHGNEVEVRQVLIAIQNDKYGIGSIDFNKIIPMPEDIFRGNIDLKEKAKYRDKNWYDWSLVHWQTKWNAYGFDETFCGENFYRGNEIKFQTAWSAPHSVIEKLAQQFPKMSFEHIWADEDLGYNVGSKQYEHGKVAMEHIPEGGSKDAYELAALVHGLDLEEIGYLYDEDAGSYTYVVDWDQDIEPPEPDILM